jgi:hypothetical protein
VVDSGHFIWEDVDDEYAALVNAWWADGFKTCMKTPTAIAASSYGSAERILAKDVTTPHWKQEVPR